MGKLKKIIVIQLFVMSILLMGCNSQSETTEADQKESVYVQNHSEQEMTKEEQEIPQEEQALETQEEIPQDLLPGQKTDKNDDSGKMKAVGKSGTEYASKKDAKSTDKTTKSETKSDAGSTQKAEDSKGTIQVDFYIDSSNADGSVSFAASIKLDKGASVYDALQASGVSHNGKSYVSAIKGLSEGMFGAQSGWKYYVNGTAPNTSCVNYTLKDGDKVVWSYVLSP